LKQKRTPTHIASSDEVGWKQQPIAKPLQENIYILPGRHAAEKNDLDILHSSEQRRVLLERTPIFRLRCADVGFSKAAQILVPDLHCSRHQATIGRDYLDPDVPLWRPGESVCVRQFSAKIKTAQEAECFTEGDAGGSQADGKGKCSALVEEDLCALPAAVSGGEKEHSKRVHGTSSRLPRPIAIRNPVVRATAADSGRGSEHGSEDLVKLLRGERLRQKRKLGIRGHKLGDFSTWVRRHKHDREPGMQVSGALGQLASVHIRHHDVGQEEADFAWVLLQIA
jgi:hypothetical protein